MKKKIRFTSSRATRLCGVLSSGLGGAERGAVVLCHGFLSSKDSRTGQSLEKELNSRGLATFRFDYFGHGESEGRFEDITVSEAVDDTFRALRRVEEEGFESLGLMGSSFGGLASLVAASRRPDLLALALKSPVSDRLIRLRSLWQGVDIENWRKQGFISFKDGAGNPRRLNVGFLDEAATISGHSHAARISVPTFIVHGSRDESVPLADSIKLNGLLPRGSLEIIPEADHRYSRPSDFDRMIAAIADFLDARL